MIQMTWFLKSALPLGTHVSLHNPRKKLLHSKCFKVSQPVKGMKSPLSKVELT